MSTIRIEEARNPESDPPPTLLAVYALVQDTDGVFNKRRHIRAMRLEPFELEAPEDAYLDFDTGWWLEDDGELYWPAGWYEAAVCCGDGPMLFPLRDYLVLAWAPLPQMEPAT